MDQQFDEWNSLKKKLNKEERSFYVHQREVWWCSLGVNIGSEANGKNENFERPVLVLNVYNKQSMLVLPVTGQEKKDRFHFPIIIQVLNSLTGKQEAREVYVKLTQARVISNKRLWRKVDMISEEVFQQIKIALGKFI